MEKTVREQLVEALEGYIKSVETAEHVWASIDWRGFAHDYRDLLQSILARHRAEPEGGDDTSCPCYQEGLEAQRERIGGGRA